MRLTHPGKLLKRELANRGISLNKLARGTRIPMSRISLIANGRRAITAETALRLARYFSCEPLVWLNLQLQYDLAVSARKSGKRINREVIPAYEDMV
jgi:addiction module HigA family antidote